MRWILGTGAFVLVNLPLVWVVWTHRDVETVLAIVGHAPNQFLFLLVLFPLAIWSTIRTHECSVRVLGELSTLGLAPWLGTFVRRGGVLVVALMIGAAVAVPDSRVTPSDFYQWEADAARHAALLNKQIVTKWAAGASDDDQGYGPEKAELAILYERHSETGIADRPILWLELIELMIAVAVAATFVVLTYVNLRANGIIAREVTDDRAPALQDMVRATIPPGVVFVSSILFWPPLRVYNINEITLVRSEYATIGAYVVYGFAGLLCVVLVWLYYQRLSSPLFAKVMALLPLVLSGGILGSVSIDPRWLVHVVGAGIELVHVVVMGMLIAFGTLFGFEVWRQALPARGQIGLR